MARKSPNDVKESKTSSGGYDCDFFESPADDLLCKICHYPARNPILTVCCGHSFCNYCLERYHQTTFIDHDRCPYCRQDNFQTVPDKRTERHVLNLKVFCPHKSQGCNWTGELRSLEDHVNENSDNNIGCPFTKLQCSNGCSMVMQRRLVEDHLKSECELREVKCEYCNTTGSYQWMISSHQEKCPNYLVECPNHCEIGHVKRGDISVHLEECPLAIVECPYAAVGCESVVSRKERIKHVTGSVEQHMECNKNTIVDTQNELEKMKSTMNNKLDNIKRELQDTKDNFKTSQEIQSQLMMALIEKGRELDEVRINAAESNRTLQELIQQLMDKLENQLKINSQLQLQLETLFNANWSLKLNYLANSGNEVVPVVIKLKEFERYMKHQDRWRSPGFYTRDGGYKMCLSVLPYGVSRTHSDVTVDVYLMKGDYDDYLTWPVKGTLTVQLLNQLSDSNHSEPKKFRFDGFSKSCNRVERVSDQGVWCNCFMPYDRLPYDDDKKCQFLMDDCVYFRVCNFQ